MIENKNLKNNARILLGNNIRYFRFKRNWSQNDLANKLGTKASYISNLENAKINVSIGYIEHIANTLNVPLEHLFEKRKFLLKK